MKAITNEAIQTVCEVVKCAVIIISSRPVVIKPYVPVMDVLVATWLRGAKGRMWLPELVQVSFLQETLLVKLLAQLSHTIPEPGSTTIQTVCEAIKCAAINISSRPVFSWPRMADLITVCSRFSVFLRSPLFFPWLAAVTAENSSLCTVFPPISIRFAYSSIILGLLAISSISYQPVVITPYVPVMEVLVATWLRGARAGCGSQNLFKSVKHLPMNAGDKHSDPLFPFGFGLVTKPGRA
ncbi:beta-glucosidase [Dendrobium catenatum]|uniref:beta-glucosidase n=1 Tax=Dendrobium catenatum TaxID=906689 RepID=A0A2I0WXA7_9ASPA|nr:beta-glucosidase [Dendrobium catenatum]